MKKSSAIILFVLCLCACGNYLNVKPQGYVIPSTDEEFAAILHSHLQDIEGGGDEYIVGNMDVIARLEACADDLDANITAGKLKIYAGEYINSRMLDWKNIYEIIRDCNIVLDNIGQRDSELALKVISCANAIKGICYLNLMRDFCEPWDAARCDDQLGLPLVDHFDISANPPRSSLRETADYTEKLLRRALSPAMDDEVFIFTEYIVKGYLARLLFWTEDWEGAAALCEDIIANSGVELCEAADYADMLRAVNERKGEVLIRSHINNASELDWYFAYVRGYIASRPASASFVRLFGEEPVKDVRLSCCIDSRRMNAKAPECRLRLSEMVLMLAECRCHQGRDGEALEWLNLLRSKRIEGDWELAAATLPAVREDSRIKVDATGKDLTPLMQAILDERRKELFLEGDRWYELKRNGRPEWWVISNGLKYTTKAYMYTAPIYKGDVDRDPNMIQNEGYE